MGARLLAMTAFINCLAQIPVMMQLKLWSQIYPTVLSFSQIVTSLGKQQDAKYDYMLCLVQLCSAHLICASHCEVAGLQTNLYLGTECVKKA